jgi:hypothetical protein
MVRVALAGAFRVKHLDGIKNIDGVEVISLVGQELDATHRLRPSTAFTTSPPILPTVWRLTRLTL